MYRLKQQGRVTHKISKLPSGDIHSGLYKMVDTHMEKGQRFDCDIAPAFLQIGALLPIPKISLELSQQL